MITFLLWTLGLTVAFKVIAAYRRYTALDRWIAESDKSWRVKLPRK